MADRLSEALESTDVQRLATDFVFTEGPLWHPDGYWLFVDIRRNLIFRIAPGGEPEVERENSGASNGLTFDLQGRLIMCEGDNRRLTRREDDGSFSVLVDQWDGKRLNRPNDVVGRSDGTIYFTNPGARIDPADREIDFNGVHAVRPDGSVFMVTDDFEYPNGLVFSPDESVLYVANTRED
ncbi:MAG: SMP-30/gluconolactonase/LRE family protein, partial [Chloroflexi bacterium]|nr:SMP-30/gluconolactonase/LRE family protein [Chloroflexota bacterium]